jgi:hypothetical protein
VYDQFAFAEGVALGPYRCDIEVALEAEAERPAERWPLKRRAESESARLLEMRWQRQHSGIAVRTTKPYTYYIAQCVLL